MSLPRSALFACALAGALAGCHRRDRDHRDMPSAKPVESTETPDQPDRDKPSTGAMDRSGRMGEPSAPSDTNPPAANPDTRSGTANPDPWDQVPETATPTPTDGTGTPNPGGVLNEDQSRDGGIPMSNHLY